MKNAHTKIDNFSFSVGRQDTRRHGLKDPQTSKEIVAEAKVIPRKFQENT